MITRWTVLLLVGSVVPLIGAEKGPIPDLVWAAITI